MNSGKSLEEFVEYVYSTLLKNENLRDIKIEKNHIEFGRAGVRHEFDVYYEIEIAHVLHKVGIECKQHNRAITKGMVQEFKAKLDDCKNIQGVMVTSMGYQLGAKDFAEYYGIKPLTINDLPNIYELLASNIKCLLPDEKTCGDPFWIIMETEDSSNTGSYIVFEKNSIILYFSKKAAEKAKEISQSRRCKVYGVTRQHLNGICAISKTFELKLLICPLLSSAMVGKDKLLLFSYSFEDIAREYLQ